MTSLVQRDAAPTRKRESTGSNASSYLMVSLRKIDRPIFPPSSRNETRFISIEVPQIWQRNDRRNVGNRLPEIMSGNISLSSLIPWERSPRRPPSTTISPNLAGGGRGGKNFRAIAVQITFDTSNPYPYLG